MHEILFRGKRADNGEWIEGCGIISTENWASIFTVIDDLEDNSADVEEYEVIPETVGQFTGLTDNNGNKIWEGDIVKAKIIELSGEKYIGIWEVAYHTKYGYFYLKRPKNNLLFDGNWSYGVTKIEVIGNIHDNSEELLKGGVDNG